MHKDVSSPLLSFTIAIKDHGDVLEFTLSYPQGGMVCKEARVLSKAQLLHFLDKHSSAADVIFSEFLSRISQIFREQIVFHDFSTEGAAKMTALSKEEALRVVWRYWDVNNTLPEDEKHMTFGEWFRKKGFVVRARNTELAVSPEMFDYVFASVFKCGGTMSTFVDKIYDELGWEVVHPDAEWEKVVWE